MARPPIPLFGLLNDPVYLPRFMAKVAKTDGCWNWLCGSARNIDGTRRACFRGPPGTGKSASRLAYAMLVGDVPEGMLVCHTCDNTMCVRPEHLYLGTHKQNTGDMIARGRSRLETGAVARRGVKGYKRPFMNRVCKLTDDQVRGVRADPRPAWVVGPAFGISEVTVAAVRARRRKAHVSDEGPVDPGKPEGAWGNGKKKLVPGKLKPR